MKENIKTSVKDSSEKGLVTIYVRKNSVSKHAKDNKYVKIFSHSSPHTCICVCVCMCKLVHGFVRYVLFCYF